MRSLKCYRPAKTTRALHLLLLPIKTIRHYCRQGVSSRPAIGREPSWQVQADVTINYLWLLPQIGATANGRRCRVPFTISSVSLPFPSECHPSFWLPNGVTWRGAQRQAALGGEIADRASGSEVPPLIRLQSVDLKVSFQPSTSAARLHHF